MLEPAIQIVIFKYIIFFALLNSHERKIIVHGFIHSTACMPHICNKICFVTLLLLYSYSDINEIFYAKDITANCGATRDIRLGIYNY